MSRLTDRLRDVVGDAVGGAPAPAPARRPAAAGRDVRDAAGVLGGTWRDTAAGRFLVVDRAWEAGHRHGRGVVGEAAPGPDGWPALARLGQAAPGPRAVFLDLETTGLAGGAGTYAFLVGCGWFEQGGFRVRQWVLTAFGAERALLDDVARHVAPGDGLVTYNGRTFDVPLLENRYALHRTDGPFEALPHLDLLHPARRMWRGEHAAAGEPGGCRLTTLERTRCGFVRCGDVPGEEIPSRYFDFVRSGDAAPLADVLEHNRLDLLSLAVLTARLGRLLDEGLAGAAMAREALGLGQLHERAGRAADARACYARAAGLDGAGPLRGGVRTRAEALRAYARACRRARLHDEAARGWHGVLALGRSPAHMVREAAEALAVHHEHRLRDLDAARRLAIETLRVAESGVRRDAVRRRLERIERKLGRPADAPAPDMPF